MNTRVRKIRYAVVGLGNISQEAMLPAFKHAKKNSILAALVSSDPKKLKTLGKRYDIETLCGYDAYEELLTSGQIDAVYIATPNSTHMKFATTALNHGIHVLCEKPMEIDEAACQQMLRASEETGARLMIAYRLHFEAANLDAIQIARSKRLGKLRIFTSSFAINVRDRKNIRLQSDLGGGPLFDIGIYCINATRYLFGEEPLEVFATAASGHDERFLEVHENVAATLRYPGGKIATFNLSFGAYDTSSYELIGTQGRLRLESAYDYAKPMTLEISTKKKTTRKKYPKRDQFGPELLAFSEAVLKNKPIQPSGEEGLADVRIIQSLYESIEKKTPITLAPFSADERPNPKNKITRPPVSRTPLVHANSPGATTH